MSGSWNACLGCGFVVFGKGLIDFRVSSFGFFFVVLIVCWYCGVCVRECGCRGVCRLSCLMGKMRCEEIWFVIM